MTGYYRIDAPGRDTQTAETEEQAQAIERAMRATGVRHCVVWRQEGSDVAERPRNGPLAALEPVRSVLARLAGRTAVRG